MKKKITAIIAALSLMMTAAVSFTTVASAADEKPTVTFTLLEGVDNTEHGKEGDDAPLGVKISFSGLEEDCKAFQFSILLPKELGSFTRRGAYEELSDKNVMNTIQYDLADELYMWATPTISAQGDYNRLTWNWNSNDMSATSKAKFNNTTTFEFDFSYDGDFVDVATANFPEKAFYVDNVQVGYWSAANALTQANGEVVVVDPTTKEEEPPVVDTTPVVDAEDYETSEAYAAGAVEGFAGAEGDTVDKAAAFKNTITNSTDVSYSNVVWKVTFGGVTKFHKMSLGGAFANGGVAKVGLAVQGVDATATAGVAFFE